MKKIFFLDFDGTITKKDTCDAMIEAFAGPEGAALTALWEKKEISTVECANRVFQLFQANLDDLAGFLDTIGIDEYFPRFLAYCETKGYPVYVLSDGYDFNIEFIFKKFGLSLPYFANRMIYDNGFQIACPHLNQACGRCGVCKRTLMERLKEPDAQTVYVGDGASDFCPASHSDIVFAKGRLLGYCRAKGIAALPMEGFQDVLKELERNN